jgi:hypothetical protein
MMIESTSWRSPRFWRHGWLLLVALIILGSGCARWSALRDKMRGPGYTDDSADWTKNVRSASKSGQAFGVDERARQIESNLGFQ